MDFHRCQVSFGSLEAEYKQSESRMRAWSLLVIGAAHWWLMVQLLSKRHQAIHDSMELSFNVFSVVDIVEGRCRSCQQNCH